MATAAQLIAGLIGAYNSNASSTAASAGNGNASGAVPFGNFIDALRNTVSTVSLTGIPSNASGNQYSVTQMPSLAALQNVWSAYQNVPQSNVTAGTDTAPLHLAQNASHNLTGLVPLTEEQVAQLLNGNSQNMNGNVGGNLFSANLAPGTGTPLLDRLTARLEAAGLTAEQIATFEAAFPDLSAVAPQVNGTGVSSSNTGGLQRILGAIASGEISVPTSFLNALREDGSPNRLREALQGSHLQTTPGATPSILSKVDFDASTQLHTAPSSDAALPEEHQPVAGLSFDPAASAAIGSSEVNPGNTQFGSSDVMPTSESQGAIAALETNTQFLTGASPSPLVSASNTESGNTVTAPNHAARSHSIENLAASTDHSPRAQAARMLETELGRPAMHWNHREGPREGKLGGTPVTGDRAAIANLLPQLRSGEISVQAAQETLISTGFPTLAAKLGKIAANANFAHPAAATSSALPQSGASATEGSLTLNGNAASSSVGPLNTNVDSIESKIVALTDPQTGEPRLTPATVATPAATTAPTAATATAPVAMAPTNTEASNGSTANRAEANPTSKAQMEETAARTIVTENGKEPAARPEAAALVQSKGLGQPQNNKPATPARFHPGQPHPAQSQAQSASSPPLLTTTALEADAARIHKLTDISVEARSLDRPATPAPAANPVSSQAPVTVTPEAIITTHHSGTAREQTSETRHALRLDPAVRAAAVQDMGIAITRFASQGLSRFQIRLDPAELGRVDVRLEMGRDGRVHAHVIADRPETLDMLRQDSRTLERAFQDAGLKTDQNSLNFSLKDHHGGATQGREGQPDPSWANGQENDDLAEGQEIEMTLTPDEMNGGLRIMGTRGIDMRI